MKKEKVLGNILFWMTLISPMISFSLASMIGEAEIFGVAGIIRYSWLMILFIPVGILSILIGLKLKKGKQEYKKNIIVAVIVLPLLAIFGSYRFIDSQVMLRLLIMNVKMRSKKKLKVLHYGKMN